MGGSLMPTATRGYAVPTVGYAHPSQCVAYPVYVMDNVPYTRGRVAGHSYSDLADIYTYTRLNQAWATKTPVVGAP